MLVMHSLRREIILMEQLSYRGEFSSNMSVWFKLFFMCLLSAIPSLSPYPRILYHYVCFPSLFHLTCFRRCSVEF